MGEGDTRVERGICFVYQRLNTELPLPKETEHKAQYWDMCVHFSVCVVSIPKGPCSASLYQ